MFFLLVCFASSDVSFILRSLFGVALLRMFGHLIKEKKVTWEGHEKSRRVKEGSKLE